MALELLSNPNVVIIKAKKFGIIADHALGIYQKDLKILAKTIGFDEALAVQLFDTGIYEARLLCSKIYHPIHLTEVQMDAWVSTFKNWEICDSFCMNLFAPSEFALAKAFAWTSSDAEFVKRAGFVIMAAYGFSHKNAANTVFLPFFPIMLREACDGRKYVSKAINWALRQVGKRNLDLRLAAIETAYQILQLESKSAKWIAKDALKELEGANVAMLNYPRKLYDKRKRE